MRRERPQHPWPFSVPQEELTYRFRVDGWTLLEVAHKRRNLGGMTIARLSGLYGVSRPTIYRWLQQVWRHSQLVEELEELIANAKKGLDNAESKKLVTLSEFQTMRAAIREAPIEAARHFALGSVEFVAWLKRAVPD